MSILVLFRGENFDVIAPLFKGKCSLKGMECGPHFILKAQENVSLRFLQTMLIFLEWKNGKVLKCCNIREMSTFLIVILLCTCVCVKIHTESVTSSSIFLHNDNSIFIYVAASGAFF